MSTEPKTDTGATATTEPPKESASTQFAAALGEILESTNHNEMWGVTLKEGDDVPTSIVLTKFLRANDGDVSAAKKQLTSALEWRKKMKPLELIKGSYNEEKFGGLGYVTTHKDEAGKETIVSWNIYGAVKDNKKTFGDVEEYDDPPLCIDSHLLTDICVGSSSGVLPSWSSVPRSSTLLRLLSAFPRMALTSTK